MVLGLIVGPGVPERLVASIAERLPTALPKRFPGTSWNVVVHIDEFAGPGVDVDLPQLARRLMLEERWDLAVCLTPRPLRVGRRPVTAEASASLGVGVISIPALGAIGLTRRLFEAVLLTIDAMLRTRAEGNLTKDLKNRLQRIEDLAKLSSTLGQPREETPGTIAFATATAFGNLRLLVGAIRGNRPLMMILGLSRALVAALAASAFGLTSPVIWRIANSTNVPRMILLTISSLFAIGFTFMASHSLWERTTTHGARTRVVLINLATSSTVAIGMIASYIALLVLNYLFGGTLIPESVLQDELKTSATASAYLRIAWLVSSLATLGGALGAVLESNAAARAAAYCIRPVPKRGYLAAASAEDTTERAPARR
jgi:hypothetical protein